MKEAEASASAESEAAKAERLKRFSYDAQLDFDSDGYRQQGLQGHCAFSRFLKKNGIGSKRNKDPDYD